MEIKQALAKAKNELAFYQQVKKDGIAMKESLEFWEAVVDALEKMRGEENV